MSFVEWYKSTGLKDINARLLELKKKELDYVVLDNLLTEEEYMVLGDTGIERLSLALAYDGADIVKVTYKDGSEEYRYRF